MRELERVMMFTHPLWRQLAGGRRTSSRCSNNAVRCCSAAALVWYSLGRGLAGWGWFARREAAFSR